MLRRVLVYSGQGAVSDRLPLFTLFTSIINFTPVESARSLKSRLSPECYYNPPSKYKVLANRSTHWPTGRDICPTGQPVGR